MRVRVRVRVRVRIRVRDRVKVRVRRRLRRWRRWWRCRWRRADGPAVRLLEIGDVHVVEVILQAGRRAASPLFDRRSRT